MEIYLLRHAAAQSCAQAGGRDENRALTPGGIRKLRRVCRWFRMQAETLSDLYSSPYRRAVETARILQEYHPGLRQKLSETLVPEGDVRRAAALLARLKPGSRVLIASHEPFLGLFAGYLASGEARSFVRFRKSGLMKLIWPSPSMNGGGAEIQWLISPGMLKEKRKNLETFGEDAAKGYNAQPESFFTQK